MKKIAKILGIVFGALFLVILIVPFVVNVDQYRPQIVKAANEHLNGTLELGKLELSLWGRVHVGIDGLKVKDAQNHEIVSVKDASFNLPFLSLLSGEPLVTLSMKNPDINVIKQKDGSLNVSSLAKKEALSSAVKSTDQSKEASVAKPNEKFPAQPETQSSPVKSAGNTVPKAEPAAAKIEVPAFVAHSHLGIWIENAKLVYQDESKAISSTVNDFNFRIKDFSLSRATEIEIWADLKTDAEGTVVQGPLKFNAELKPDISNGEFKSATVVALFTADDLEIAKGALFHKAKGDPANFKFNGTLSGDHLKLAEATATFHNAQITVSGEVNHASEANLEFRTKPIDLKSWSELVPMLKAYELEGLLSLSGFVKGPATALDYQATLNLKNFSAKGPNLKAKPVLNADVQVNTDRLDHLTVDLKAPGTDLQFWAKVVSFTKPQAEFKIASEHGVDLDQWVEFPKKAASLDRRSGVFESDAFAAEDSKAKATASPAADLDASLDSLRTNALLKEMAVEGDVSLAFVKAQNTKIDHILAKLQFKNLIAALSGLSLQVFGGTVKGAFSTDLKPEHPNYTLKLEVSSLDMTKAAEAQFPTFKDTLSGQLSTQIEGGGSSFNTEMAKKKLLMKGSFHLADAKFQSMDISKMVGEALSGSMGKIGDKIPGLKGKKISPPGSINGDTRYEMVSANFTIQNGVLDAPDFYAKSAPKKGIDLKGATKMGLIDQALDAKWEVIDSQHITGADQLSVDLGGKTVKNILAKSENDPVILPITVGCKWSAPCPNYKDVPEFLAGIALSRVTHGAGEAAKKQVTDAVQNAVKNNLGSGLKKIFGH